MRHVTKFIEGDSCNLLEEIENFERDLKTKGVKKNTTSAKVTETVDDEDEYEGDEDIDESDEDVDVQDYHKNYNVTLILTGKRKSIDFTRLLSKK